MGSNDVLKLLIYLKVSFIIKRIYFISYFTMGCCCEKEEKPECVTGSLKYI